MTHAARNNPGSPRYTPDPSLLCLHCGWRRGRARGLCTACYDDPRVRRKYPRKVGNPANTGEPTAAELERTIREQRECRPPWWWEDSLNLRLAEVEPWDRDARERLIAMFRPQPDPAVQPGALVRILTPDIPRLHGTEATVAAVETWGAHLAAPAAVTGRFRAAWHEMEVLVTGGPPASTVAHNGTITLYQGTNGESHKKLDGTPTGDFCQDCGSGEMVRAGPCLRCNNCGSTNGGCS